MPPAPGQVILHSQVPFIEAALLAIAQERALECVQTIEDAAVKAMLQGKPAGSWYAVPEDVVLSPYAVTRTDEKGVVYYRASREGQWPAIRTGVLVGSFQQTIFPAVQGPGWEARVGTNVPYGPTLEFDMDRSFLLRAAYGPVYPRMLRVLRRKWDIRAVVSPATPRRRVRP